MASVDFDALITRARPHILEKICLSLDYESFKNCVVVNEEWKGVLTSNIIQKMAKNAFKNEILGDQKNLIHASRKGKAQEIRKLLSTGMLDVEFISKFGEIDNMDTVERLANETPLLKASQRGYKDIVEMLIKGGADPNKADRYGRTPIRRAAEKGYNDVVKLLLDNGADPNQAIKDAACHGHNDVVQLILDRGAEHSQTGKNGWTPLFLAANEGHKDVVQLLLDTGANPNQADQQGRTPLHEAAKWGHKDVVQLLLDRGAEISKLDEHGWTPLHSGAYLGRRNVVQILLENGACPNIRGTDGRKPLDLAAILGYNDIGEMLKRAMEQCCAKKQSFNKICHL